MPFEDTYKGSDTYSDIHSVIMWKLLYFYMTTCSFERHVEGQSSYLLFLVANIYKSFLPSAVLYNNIFS